MSQQPDWRKQHFVLEKQWAEKIQQTAKGSSQRQQYLEQGYDEVIGLINQNEPGGCGSHENTLMAHCIAKFAQPADKIIDIGCGEGDLVYQLLQLGFDAYGVDVSNVSIAGAKQRLAEIQQANRAWVAQLADLQPGYNGIGLNNVIEHLVPDEIDDFVADCVRILRPGGWLFNITPHRYSGPHDVSRYFLPLGSTAQGFHFKEFTLAELQQLFQAHGLRNCQGYWLHPKIYKVFGLVPRPSTLALRKNLLAERLFSRAIGRAILRWNDSLTRALVATLFPNFIVAYKPRSAAVAHTA